MSSTMSAMPESTSTPAGYTDSNNYGYVPSEAWCIAFIVLFSLSAIAHSFQAYRAKYWVIYPTLVVGCITEILGWSGRLWSNQNVLFLTPFLMQISTLILAPCFFSAWDYVLLGSAISKLGPQYSLLRPIWYFFIFISVDLLSIILQAVGGGMASGDAADGSPTDTATDIMVAGIILQLISMVVFVGLSLDFILRAGSKRPYQFQVRRIERKQLAQSGGEAPLPPSGPSPLGDEQQSSGTTLPTVNEKLHSKTATDKSEFRKWWILLFAALISSCMIVARGVYRSIELKQGWTGFLITHQIYQNVLDGIPMVIAVAVFNFIHPSYLLPRKSHWKDYHLSE